MMMIIMLVIAIVFMCLITLIHSDPYTKRIKKSRTLIYEGISGTLIEQYLYMKNMYYISSLFQRSLVIVNSLSYSMN